MTEQLPAGWTLATVRDVTEPTENIDPRRIPRRTFRYVDIGSIDNQTQRIVRPKTFVGRDAPARAGRRIRSGDIVFSTVRTYLRNIAIVPPELNGEVASTGLLVLRANDAVLGDYLFRWVSSPVFLEQVSAAQDGTLYPAVREGDVRRQQLPLAPLAEQQLIVEKLNVLTHHLRKVDAYLATGLIELGEYRSRVLAGAFRFGGKTRMLGEIIHGFTAGKSVRCEERAPQGHENGVIKVSAVTWGVFDPTESKTLPRDFTPAAKAKIREGDLLFSRANTRELVGAVVVVEHGPPNLYLSDKILRIEVNDDDRRWLLWFLRSPQGRRQLEELASGNQASMKNITQGNVRRVLVPYPGSGERAEIIRHVEERISAANRATSAIRQMSTDISTIEGRITSLAFEGRLTKRQVGAEPAAVLLHRVSKANQARLPAPARQSGRSGVMGVTRGIRSLLESWPTEGLTFDDIRKATGQDYVQLKAELFDLLTGSSQLLYQDFVDDEELMKFKKVTS